MVLQRPDRRRPGRRSDGPDRRPRPTRRPGCRARRLAAAIDSSSDSAISITRALLRSQRPEFEVAAAAEPMVRSFVSGEVAAAAERFTQRAPRIVGQEAL